MMTREVYLKELSRHIRALPSSEVNDILADYAEYFDAGKAAGKTEAQIADGLGNPKAVSHEILMNNLVTEAESSTSAWKHSEVILRMLMLFFVLAPFNFIIVLGPFLGLCGVLIAGWAIPLAIGAAAIGLAGAAFHSFSIFGILGALTSLSLFFMWIFALSVTVMLGIVMLVVSKAVFKMLIAYVKWNVNFITARKA